MRTLIVLFSMLVSLPVMAGDIISDPATLKQIFTGKTASAVNLKKEVSYEVYFAPDGSIHRVTEDGEKHSGTWHISDDGKHCVHFSHKPKGNCRAVLAGNRDGVYFRIKQKGDRKIKIIRLKNFRDGDKLPKE